MIYTLFFSAKRDLGSTMESEYTTRLAEVKQRAVDRHPGFVDMRSFTADDGERLTVVRFRDGESQRGWRLDSLHRESQMKGRTDYYERYRVVVCDELRS